MRVSNKNQVCSSFGTGGPSLKKISFWQQLFRPSLAVSEPGANESKIDNSSPIIIISIVNTLILIVIFITVIRKTQKKKPKKKSKKRKKIKK